jgi:hypothetical protein
VASGQAPRSQAEHMSAPSPLFNQRKILQPGRSTYESEPLFHAETHDCQQHGGVASSGAVCIANPLQVKAIARAHVKTDKIDAGTLASLQAAGYLPQIWTPDAETERKRRLVARRY